MVQCHSCEVEREGKWKCSGCNSKVVYCSKACQITHWPTHIFDCYAYRGKRVPSAYHLARSCYRDELPTDDQTLEDYGFHRAAWPSNQTMLLGLYRGLFIYFQINPKSVLTWKREGILIQEIKKVFEGSTSLDRGQYYPWFLEHQYLLDPSVDSTKVKEVIRLEAAMRAWRHIGGRPLHSSTAWNDIILEKATWPEHKQDCFDLCTMLLSKAHPNPSLRSWLSFGFCTTQNQYYEKRLGVAYSMLVVNCSFEEFYQAYDSCSLIQLFSSKNISLEPFGSHLADFLANSPHMNKSVWDLKQFVLAETSDSNPIPSVTADYGFFNCQNEAEVAQLKEAYKKFFEDSSGDPLKLHEACLQGKIYDYVVKKTLKLKGYDQGPLFQLMKNFYPLSHSES